MKLATDFDFKTNVTDGLAVMTQPQPQHNRSIELQKPIKPFHDGDQRSLGKALNEDYWRHGITVSLGNGMSVSEENAKRRLRYIALHLKRRIWGNNHRKQRNIEFIVFKHQLVNQHKNKEENEAGSQHRSDKWQKDLVDRRHRALQTSRGKPDRFGEHYHAVMAIKGSHGWSDQEIADTIIEIEADRTREWRGEKAAHVDWDWKSGNRFHNYIGREVRYDGDSYFIMRV